MGAKFISVARPATQPRNKHNETPDLHEDPSLRGMQQIIRFADVIDKAGVISLASDEFGGLIFRLSRAQVRQTTNGAECADIGRDVRGRANQ